MAIGGVSAPDYPRAFASGRFGVRRCLNVRFDSIDGSEGRPKMRRPALLRRPGPARGRAHGRRRAGRAAGRPSRGAAAARPAATARSSCAWRPRAASCTGRGPIRPSARSSSTSCTPARAATTPSAWSPACARRRHRGRADPLPDRPRRLPVRLPRLLRARAPRRPGPDARGDGADGRARVRAARAAPAGGQHPARQRRLDRARALRRLPARGLLAALPADRRPVARPRALRDHGRRRRGAG